MMSMGQSPWADIKVLGHCCVSTKCGNIKISTVSLMYNTECTHPVGDADVGELEIVLLVAAAARRTARGVVKDDHVVHAVLSRRINHRRRLDLAALAAAATTSMDQLVRQAPVGQQHLKCRKKE